MSEEVTGRDPHPKARVGIAHSHDISLGPSPAVPVLGRLGQGFLMCGMGMQTLHSVKAEPSPRGSSAEHWEGSPEIWGCSWHFPAALLTSFSSLSPLIFMQHYWPPIFQSHIPEPTPWRGRCPDPLQNRPFL